MSTMTKTEAETRVARGAAFLDERLPGWWEKIDLVRLNIESPCNCILGQKFGDYTDGIFELGAKALRNASALGFTLASYDEITTYVDLTEAWLSSILSRRQQSEHRASLKAADVLPGPMVQLTTEAVTTLG